LPSLLLKARTYVLPPAGDDPATEGAPDTPAKSFIDPISLPSTWWAAAVDPLPDYDPDPTSQWNFKEHSSLFIQASYLLRYHSKRCYIIHLIIWGVGSLNIIMNKKMYK